MFTARKQPVVSNTKERTLREVLGGVLPQTGKGANARVKLCGVYWLLFPNGKGYVGQSVDIQDRWKQHERERRQVVDRAIGKHGWNNVSKHVLVCCDRSELNEYETHFISSFATLHPNGYNILKGGQPSPMSAELSKLNSIKKQELIRSERLERLGEFVDQDKFLEYLNDNRSRCRVRNQVGLEHTRGIQKRAETWEAKLQAKLDLLSPEEADKKRRSVESRRASRNKWKRNNKAKADADVKAYLGVHRHHYNQQRPCIKRAEQKKALLE